MPGPKCERCERSATIHETTIEAGKAIARHYCPEHGKTLMPPLDPEVQAAGLLAVEEYYNSLSDAERENLALLYRLQKRGI